MARLERAVEESCGARGWRIHRAGPARRDGCRRRLPRRHPITREELWTARTWRARSSCSTTRSALSARVRRAGWGVGLVCGQGINAGAIAPNGRQARFPGVGDIAGDWGGGGGIGMAALQAAVRGDDGRGPRTSLESSVPAFFGVQTPAAMTRAFYFGRISGAARQQPRATRLRRGRSRRRGCTRASSIGSPTSCRDGRVTHPPAPHDAAGRRGSARRRRLPERRAGFYARLDEGVARRAARAHRQARRAARRWARVLPARIGRSSRRRAPADTAPDAGTTRPELRSATRRASGTRRLLSSLDA